MVLGNQRHQQGQQITIGDVITKNRGPWVIYLFPQGEVIINSNCIIISVVIVILDYLSVHLLEHTWQGVSTFNLHLRNVMSSGSFLSNNPGKGINQQP